MNEHRWSVETRLVELHATHYPAGCPMPGLDFELSLAGYTLGGYIHA